MIKLNQNSSNPWTDGAYLGLTKRSENQQRGLCSTIARNPSLKQVKWRKPHRHKRNRHVVVVVVVVVVIVVVVLLLLLLLGVVVVAGEAASAVEK